MLSPVLLHLLFVATLARSTPRVTYDELRRLNATCDGLDTCRRPFNDDLRSVNCQCGPSCARLGTCCLDAPCFREGGSYGGGLGCATPYGNDNALFMVDKCPNDWDGDDSVRDLCVGDGQESSDLMLLLPVSSLQTGITYRNYFCFVCHSVDDPEDSVISWDIGLLFSNRSNAGDVDLSTLTFDSGTFQWTYPGAPQNSILRLSTEPPRKLPEKNLNYCRGNVISSCATNWTQPATRAKCESYTALVTMKSGYFSSNTYRNVHCGTCNWVDTSVVQCSDYRVLGGGFADPAYSAAAKVYKELFRVSEEPEKESRVGQVYDKTAKRWRNVRCGRKMEMVKGKCVRKASM